MHLSKITLIFWNLHYLRKRNDTKATQQLSNSNQNYLCWGLIFFCDSRGLNAVQYYIVCTPCLLLATMPDAIFLLHVLQFPDWPPPLLPNALINRKERGGNAILLLIYVYVVKVNHYLTIECFKCPSIVAKFKHYVTVNKKRPVYIDS